MKALNRNIIVKLFAIMITIAVCSVLISEYYDFVDKNNLVSRMILLGAGVMIIFLPYCAVMLNETWGWINCFGKDSKQIAIHKMLLIRIATETLQQSLPGGAVYAELVRPYLLKKHLNFEYPESISANVVTKLNILIAQIIFLIFGLLIFITYSAKTIASSGLFSEQSYQLTGIIFISVTLLFAYLLYKKHLMLRIVDLMEKTNLKPVRKLFNKIHNNAMEIDNIVSNFFMNHKTRLLLTITLFFFTWIFMALESLVILKVMGINASIFQMIMIESIISIVRMTFFFLPGALGPQDLSIIVLFNLAGLPDPSTNAVLFVLLKRIKELVWIIIGYILLMLLGIKTNELILRKHKIDFAVNHGIVTKY
jgi:uncharacterized protein (TIRG00374 family)